MLLSHYTIQNSPNALDALIFHWAFFEMYFGYFEMLLWFCFSPEDMFQPGNATKYICLFLIWHVNKPLCLSILLLLWVTNQALLFYNTFFWMHCIHITFPIVTKLYFHWLAIFSYWIFCKLWTVLFGADIHLQNHCLLINQWQ